MELEVVYVSNPARRPRARPCYRELMNEANGVVTRRAAETPFQMVTLDMLGQLQLTIEGVGKEQGMTQSELERHFVTSILRLKDTKLPPRQSTKSLHELMLRRLPRLLEVALEARMIRVTEKRRRGVKIPHIDRIPDPPVTALIDMSGKPAASPPMHTTPAAPLNVASRPPDSVWSRAGRIALVLGLYYVMRAVLFS